MIVAKGASVKQLREIKRNSEAMDQDLVYAKTSAGDEAVRQTTRVVQRNHRLVLVQVDGKTTVGELAAKVGNSRLVENALKELEEGGFIIPAPQGMSVWETGKKMAKEIKAAVSQFSSFEANSLQSSWSQSSESLESGAPTSFSRSAIPEAASQPVSAPRLERKRRFRPAAAVRLLLGLFVVFCLGLVFYPYNLFKPDIEAALGKFLQMPVQVGNVAVGLLPRPALLLQNVEVGEKSGVHVDEIRVPAAMSLLGIGRREIPVVEIRGARMQADSLGVLLGAAGNFDFAAAGYGIARARLENLVLQAGDVALRGLEGDAFFKPDGSPEKLLLQTGDRTLRIEAVPSPMGAVLNIEGNGWRPAEGSAYAFDALHAKGLLQGSRLVLQDIDTTFFGGILKGNWLLDWKHGLAMAGEATLAHVNARKALEALAPTFKAEGELSGSLHLRGGGNDWDAMWAHVEAVLDADIVHGAVDGIDLGEAARRGAGDAVGGGSTKFDRLRGVFRIDPRQVTGSDIRMTADLVTANGHFVAGRDRKVDGVFDVSIGHDVAGVRMPIRISGVLPDLVAAAGR